MPLTMLLLTMLKMPYAAFSGVMPNGPASCVSIAWREAAASMARRPPSSDAGVTPPGLEEGRPCSGSSQLRAIFERSHVVDPADRAATGTQRFDLDHRGADAVAQKIVVLGDLGLALVRQRDVER